MAIEWACGATEHGKSWFVNNRIAKKYKKVIVFDHKNCFDGDRIMLESNQDVLDYFRKYNKKSSYRIAIKTTRGGDLRAFFERACILAMSLGRTMGEKSPERVLFVVDEADSICSPSRKPVQLQNLADYGRHDNVDSFFIARDPNTLNMNIRRNADKVYSFRVSGASRIGELRGMFSKDQLKRLEVLPKYECFAWNSNGQKLHINKKGKAKELA